MSSNAAQSILRTLAARRSRSCALLCFAACIWASVAAHAQEPQRRENRGGVIIFQERLIITGPDAATVSEPQEDLIPPDEELLNLKPDEMLLKDIARLDHEDFEVREAAMKAIAERPGDNHPLYAVLARRDELALSPEQHARLMSAIRHRIMNKEAGALGISMRLHTIPGEKRVEVEVTDLLPGLPAREVLRLGDRITAINGEQLEGGLDLTTQIQQHKPGDVITLTVIRPKRDANGRFMMDNHAGMVMEELQIPIKLGSTEHLVDPQTGQPQISNVVANRRKLEVTEANRRFGRDPVVIELEGELPDPAAAAAEAGKRRRVIGDEVGLFERPAPPPRPELAEALFAAILDSNEPLALQLIEQGAPVNATSDRDVTVLHYAARATMPIVTRRLLELGADVHAGFLGNVQPIHWAARAGCADRPGAAETVDVLLEFGADINAVTHDGVRPVTYAIQFGNDAWRDALIARGAVIE